MLILWDGDAMNMDTQSLYYGTEGVTQKNNYFIYINLFYIYIRDYTYKLSCSHEYLI